MKGLALDKTGSLILVLIGVSVAVGVVLQIFSGTSINVVSIFESNVNNCPSNQGFDNITFQELNSRTTEMINLDCSDRLVNVTVEERISQSRLKDIALNLDLKDDQKPLYFVYPDCNTPEGIKGIITNVESRLVAGKEDLVNITWKSNSVRICVN
jgi:hypothetical protein